MDKYMELLRYFNTYTESDDILHTRSYVSIDNIHDSIIFTDINMKAPLKYYIIKSKQFAINEHRNKNKQYKVLAENLKSLIGVDFEFDVLIDYNFTSEELDIIHEILRGVRRYKSAYPRREYEKILKSIKEKINLS